MRVRMSMNQHGVGICIFVYVRACVNPRLCVSSCRLASVCMHVDARKCMHVRKSMIRHGVGICIFMSVCACDYLRLFASPYKLASVCMYVDAHICMHVHKSVNRTRIPTSFPRPSR